MTKKLVWIALFSFIFVMSCAEKESKTAKANKGKPHISFDTTRYDFGQAKSGEELIVEFDFTNTGKGSLRISRIESSCGCTVANYPKEDIAPGQGGTIQAIFDTGGFSGYQYKTLLVYTNADNSPVKLEITGTIQ